MEVSNDSYFLFVSLYVSVMICTCIVFSYKDIDPRYETDPHMNKLLKAQLPDITRILGHPYSWMQLVKKTKKQTKKTTPNS